VLAPRAGDGESGPIATMAVTPGLSQWLWVAGVLVFAPLAEEPLFRGVLYAGFRNSFGAVWAAIGTTFLFVILHITEMIYFWPSAIGITGLALAALWLRLRSAAIGPAVAVHCGYNAMIVLGAFTFAGR
jgi:CAAX protease family protein